MLRSRPAVANRPARQGPIHRRLRAFSGWAALLASIGACGTDPRIPTTVSLSVSAISFTALGQTQQLFPAVSDQDGKPLAGADVSWTSSNTGLATVSPSGVVTAVGSGIADITATSGPATATVQVTIVQTPTELLKVSGDGQNGTAGTALPAPLVVQVNDAGGSPIPGRTATFTVTQGDGILGAATAVTGSDGRASTSFTTGTLSGSPQGVSVSIEATALSVSFTETAAADPTSFNIGLRYLSTATAAQKQAFTAARLRWQAIITQDLEDGLLDVGANSSCGDGWPAVNQNIDDVMILVRLEPIDGAGQVLGSAGPCWIRDTDSLSLLGAMSFDTADLQQLETDGLLSSVILHEMGHVLGIGTLWDFKGLLADPSLPSNPSADPHFTGAQARTAFNLAGGTAYTAGKVPVDNSVDAHGNPLPGTADAHWRESVLGNELMTGFIGPGPNPLSRITIASLADQGYSVNLATADAYSFMLSLRAFDNRPTLLLQNDILRGPIRKVDRHGRVTGEFRR
jgi:Big-like domain-containing protein/leishmanolysin